MLGTSAPRGPGRAVLPVLVLIGLGLAPGCASTRGPVMTPAGPRWLGPADPIAASRPPAITYDPYKGAAPESSPGALARFFPGQRAGQSTSPALQPMAGPGPGELMAEAKGGPEPSAPRRATARRPLALAAGPIEPAAEQPRPRQDEVLPVALALDTFRDAPNPSDPDTRLVSQRAGEMRAEVEAESGDEPSPLIEGPGELPDFGGPEPATADSAPAEAAPPASVRPETGIATDPALGTVNDQPRRSSPLKVLLGKLRKGDRPTIGLPRFRGSNREVSAAAAP